ncbi:MAG: hypothetical protein ACOC6S_03320 [Chloroflexota bacterium]
MDKHIPADFITLYYINRPDGEGIDEWANIIHRGIRWFRFGSLAKYVPKAREEIEAAAAVYMLTAKGNAEAKAFERVCSLIGAAEPPDPGTAHELWLWYEEYKKQTREEWGNDAP